MKRLLLTIMLIFVLAVVGGCGKKDKVEEPAIKEKVEAPPMKDKVEEHAMVEPEKIEEITPEGQKSMEGRFVDGKMNGTWRSWYENGQLQREENYVDNFMEGKQSFWYESGKMRKESWYKAGKLHGKETMWDEEGNLLSSVEYVNGVAVAPLKKGG